MPSFGDKSKRILSTCDPRLQELAELVVESYDITVLEGFRTNARQDELTPGKTNCSGRENPSYRLVNPSITKTLASQLILLRTRLIGKITDNFITCRVWSGRPQHSLGYKSGKAVIGTVMAASKTSRSTIYLT
jgi:hypothetical protein